MSNMEQPISKKRRLSDEVDDDDDKKDVDLRIPVQLKSESGELVGTKFDLPLKSTAMQLQLIVNAVLEKNEKTPYSFFVGEREITGKLSEVLTEAERKHSDNVIDIVYQPQAVFKVRAVTRCTSTIEGHADAVISLTFSPNGQYLASGSGDTTVRLWDLGTETPRFTLKAHKTPIFAVSFSPDGKKLASGGKSGKLCIWDPETGKQIGKTMDRHTKWINCIVWKPLHLDPESRYVATASKDSTVRIWDTVMYTCTLSLTSHLQSVTIMRWGGTNLIYTASQDRTIKVWKADEGTLCRTLQGHGHWVNTMSLNTDYALRTGAFDPAFSTIVPKENTMSLEEMKTKALEIYNRIEGPELMVTGSDDFKCYLWEPQKEKKPKARMDGHLQTVNQVLFSPDGRIIASASFDKSVKLWNGKTGQFMATLRGHVNRVYQVCWSADSRLLCSASADSTCKVWDAVKGKLKVDLPGHADEVYALDWSPDGQRVASGGKDKVLKIWRH